MLKTSLLLSALIYIGSVQSFTIGGRIVNGQPSAPGQFPHQALIIGTGIGGSYLCGGNLISDQWVLTAGHCVRNIISFEVHLGAQSLRNYSEPGRVILRSTNSILHEEYNPNYISNDVGLIKLPSRVQLSSRIQPVKLANSTNSFSGRTVIASGWGLTSSSQSQPAAILQYAELQVITNQECAQTYTSLVVRNGTLCAKGLKNQSTCSGDSGGPIILKDTKELVGITSFGHVNGCDFGIPVGFSRVTYYRDWITRKTGVKF